MEPIIIIGTGLAGYNLAREFRKLDQTTPLLLITSSDGSFYSKPMLSNALAKDKTADGLITSDATKMATDLNAEIMGFTRVQGIDTKSHCINTSQGDTIHYQKLVLAMGAEPIQPPLSGDGVELIYTVNDLHDYREFRDALNGVRHVAIIGPGLIGCEFANDLLSAGYEVSVIGPDVTPLGRLLPPAAGEMMQESLAAAGVRWHLQRNCYEVNKVGPKFILKLDQGEAVEADLVLSAIGLRPDLGLARSAGLKTNLGIVVDRYLATSDADIYALGDCAEVDGRMLPFIMPLMQCTRALARTLAGETTAVNYPAMPVVVKTPACPCVIAPPAPTSEGEWQVEQTGDGVKALYISKAGDLLGFALLGTAVAQKQALTKGLPAVMA